MRACNLARSTVLYYESIGLLPRPRRTPGNCRAYTEEDLGRLRQIRAYRDAGLELGDIRSILDAPHTAAAAVLRRRLVELSAGIERLQEHQEFLEFLHIPEEEVKAIREWTRGQSGALWLGSVRNSSLGHHLLLHPGYERC